MTISSFIDYYDLMQISQNADEDTIQQMFRYLAKKWHPDNPKGDPERFRLLVEAHKILTNAERRAAYDLKYQGYWEAKWNIVADAADGQAFISENEIRERLLSLYYVQRRSKMNDPGLGELEVSRLMRVPIHLIEFQIWYLKEKSWIMRLENGKLALTVSGVDEVEKKHLQLNADRLLVEHTENSNESEETVSRHIASIPESIAAEMR